jgi:septal ring factor EnvC (AmiA/AmiB activator)
LESTIESLKRDALAELNREREGKLKDEIKSIVRGMVDEQAKIKEAQKKIAEYQDRLGKLESQPIVVEGIR